MWFHLVPELDAGPHPHPLSVYIYIHPRDTFFDAQQALEFGVIDSVLTKRPAVEVRSFSCLNVQPSKDRVLACLSQHRNAHTRPRTGAQG